MTVWCLVDWVRSWADMSRAEAIATIGAFWGFLGGSVLAFAVGDELRAHRLAILGLQAETKALIAAFAGLSSPLFQISGTENHIERGQRKNGRLTKFGIFALLLSLAFTVGAFFVKEPIVSSQKVATKIDVTAVTQASPIISNVALHRR